MNRVTLFALLLLSCVACAHAFEALPMERDLTYVKRGETDLKLDFVRPKGDGPFPLVICIHGGGWREGNKSSMHGTMQGLARQGFAAASVQYRFCPANKFPAQVEDVKTAVRFLRSKAGELKIDSKHVGALGYSAGGHLALMLGLLDKDDKGADGDGLEGGTDYADQSSKVQAVVNNFGPTDLTVTDGERNPVVYTLINDFLGTIDQNDAVFLRASPITYISKNDPPILTFHGTADPLVPVDQAKRLHKALKEAKVPEQLEMIEGAGHGWKGEQADKINKKTLEFLKANLAQ